MRRRPAPQLRRGRVLIAMSLAATIAVSTLPASSTTASPEDDPEDAEPSEQTTTTVVESPAGPGEPDGPPPTDDPPGPGETTTTVVEEIEPGPPDGEETTTNLVVEDDEGEDAATTAADVVLLAAQDSTIRVHKAGDRLGLSRDLGASGLAGATFAAYRKGTSTNQNIPGGLPEATCVTDVTGTCDLLVDSVSERYLVVEQSAPPGWTKIDEIALGRFNASGTNRPYRWNVEVSAGGVTHVPRTEIINRIGQTWRDRPNPAGALGRNDYRWADVRANPLLPVQKCGLDIALMFDQSGSIGDNQSQVRSAASDFIDQLTGTPTQVAIFTFSTNSPQNGGASQNRPALVPITEPQGAGEVKSYINGLSPAGGGTNWDHGLREIAAAAPAYDVAIVLTDGNPTAWRGETSSAGDVDDYDVEEAVHSANWLKSLGTRIITIGFSGQAGGLTATNLALISGDQEGDPDNPKLTDDYFLTTFGELADLLTAIALNNCGGTINVDKKISPTWTGIDGVPLEPNWPFERDAAQDYVTPQSGTTGPQGQPLQFKVTFEQNELERDVTVFEPNLGPNIPIADPGTGKNARCTITGETNADSRIVDVGNNGVTILDVTDQEIVSCLFVNSPLQLQAQKYQDTNGNGRQDDPADEPFLSGWTIFLDDNGNSQLDPGETSAVTDVAGNVFFDRLAGPGDYRVCEVQQNGFFNTDPGGGAVCKIETVNFPTQPVDPVPPAGPVKFGNIEAGGFDVTKSVVDDSGLVPADTEYTIEVDCEFNGQPVAGFDPLVLTLEDGEAATVGPLAAGTTCTIDETDQQGAASVDISQPSVTLPADDGITVTVTNTYPTGQAQVQKVTDGELAELAPAGTQFTVEVSCTYPAGFPVQGAVPGFDPKELTIEAGAPGQPGTPGPTVDFGQPLPVGTECTIVETDDNGASDVTITPSGTITITDSAQPITVTVTNTYDPAALRILKEVQGATLPPDTEFSARVVCTFQGQTTFDEIVTFGIGPTNPGIVSDQPVGAECTVTETEDHGADNVEYTPGQTVILQGQDPVSVDVTITNTFGTGDLTIAKVVDDNGTGLVPGGTSFTVNVDCQFAGNPVPGYPQDIVFTTPNQLSETLTGLPVGTECTVTETDDAGAGNVVITPAQPVTITSSAQGPVDVTVTNVFDTDEFDVTKVVDDPAGLVPADTEYTIQISCTYPLGYPATGPIPGFDPKVVVVTGGQTVSSGELPVGAVCNIDETGTGGAGTVDVVPDVVVVGAGGVPITVTVTNVYPVGALDLRKAVDDGGTGAIPLGTDYVLRVNCVYPAGHPSQGPIPGFDPIDVTVPSGTGGQPGSAVTVGAGALPAGNGGLPVGSECTVSEPDPQGATSVEITPQQPVTITDDLTDPVEVVATNTYPVGSGEVVKVTDGALAPQFAPPGSQFLVAVACVYPAGFPVSGPIPGFDPLGLTIGAGDPGQPGTPAPFGPVPIGSECTVTEIDDGGATTVDIAPAQPVTITDEQTPVTVTVTNTFDPAGLKISKVVDGQGGPPVPPDLVYTAHVTCTFVGQTVFDQDVDFGEGDTTVIPGPGAVTGLPVGSECTVTEVETHGATAVVSPSGPFLLEGPDPVSVDVTITNSFAPGELTVTKVVDGIEAGLVPAGTTYSVSVQCTIDGSPLVDFPMELTLTTPDQLTQTLDDLPVGAECFASETDTNGAASPPTFDPPGAQDFQSGVVTIEQNPQNPITITVTNTYPGAGGEIVKVVDGPQSGLAPPGTQFPVTVTCQLPPDHPAAPGPVPGFDPLMLTIEAGQPGQPGPAVGFGTVPVGSSCTVAETDDGGATGVVITPPQPVTIVDEQTPVEITVTNTFDDGGLTVIKVVDGPAGGLVPVDTVYTVRLACTFGGQPVFDQELPVDVANPAVVPNLPVGAECTVTETDSQGAGGVVIDPAGPVVITGAATPVEVTVTNTYPAGTAQFVKVVDGPLGSLAPAGTQFTLEVDCQLPAGFPGAPGPVPGYPTAVVIEAGTTGQPGPPVEIGPLPEDSSCTVTETDSNGASEVVITPDAFTIDQPDQQVDVTVTNTYEPAALRVLKVVDGPGGPLVPPDTVFMAEVVCVPPAGSPAAGFNGEVMFGVNDPAIVSGQTVGSECTVTETGDQGASNVSYSPSVTVTLVGQDPVSVDVTVTNTFEAGELTVTKALAGGGAGFVPDGTEFTVSVDCVFAGNAVPGYPQDVVVAAPDGSVTLSGLPLGTECTVTETDDQGAQDVDIAPAQPVTIAGGQTPVEVTVTNTFETGELVVTKLLDGDAAPFVPDGTTFTVQVTCTFLGVDLPVETASLTTPDPLSRTVTGLPVGASCTVAETEDNGAQNVVIDPTVVVVLPGGTPVEVLITNIFDPGSLTIDKVLTGNAASTATGPFTFDIECTYLGTPVDPQPDPVTIVPPATSAQVDGLPIGATCTVSEQEPYGGAAGPPTIEPASVVIGADDPVAVEVTNTFTVTPSLPSTGSSGVDRILRIATILALVGFALAVVAYRRRGRDLAT